MVRNLKRLVISLGVCFAAGALGSVATFPALTSWYVGITKPDFNPPNWIFGPVWTLLYIVMGLSLYLIWMQKTKRSKRSAYVLFGVQLGLNALWSIVFFGLHQPFLAVGVVIALLGFIITTAIVFWPISRRAAYLLVPYILWVSFASALNVAIAILNPSLARVTNYDQCVHANGSTVLLTFPSICVTRDGERFTGDAQ